LEHDVNDQVTVRNQFRYANYGRSGRIAEPLIVYTGITPATPLAALQVNRNMIAVTSTETFLQNQTDMIVRFHTGIIEHAVVAGLEFGRETSAPIRLTYSNVPRSSLLFPNPSTPFVSPSRINTQVYTQSNIYSAYIMDTLKLGEHWELTGGFRWDTFSTSYKQIISPAVQLSLTDNMPSFRGALIYKPAANGSIYFSYGTSFNPSAESLSLAASNAGLAPEENQSFEIGTKWNLGNNQLSVSGAVFQIEKTNARVPDPNNAAFNILGGNQRVRGFEVGLTGRLTERWEVYYGYAYLDSRVTSSTLPATVGQPLGNTPQNTLSLWNTYTLPWHGIQLGGGLQWVSSRIASSTPNSTTGLIEQAPGYFTIQGMVKYPVTPAIDLQLNIYNITNARYYDLLHPSHVVPGSSTAALLSATFGL